MKNKYCKPNIFIVKYTDDVICVSLKIWTDDETDEKGGDDIFWRGEN